MVHARLGPGYGLADVDRESLVILGRLPVEGRPNGYDLFRGPDRMLCGHQPSSEPRIFRAEGRTVALGLDTGCVHRGRLSAYSPELDESRQVSASRPYPRP